MWDDTLIPDTARRQLDLFLDGRDVALVNEIIARLVGRDARRAGEALDHLREANPRHADLAALARLRDALRPLPVPADPVALSGQIDDVERSLVPLASRLLGADAAQFLRPVWETLAAAAAPPFNDSHPHAHRAWLCQRYEDWSAVASGVESVPGWSEKPFLRYWLGLARHHLGAPEAALRLWLSVCWLDPKLFAEHAPAVPSLTVRQAWEAFERASALEGVFDDDPDRTPWFPVWILLRDRGMVHLFDPQDIPETVTAAVVFRRLLVLLPLERGGLSDELIQRRRALQQVSPRFFRYYLEVVGQRRPGA